MSNIPPTLHIMAELRSDGVVEVIVSDGESVRLRVPLSRLLQRVRVAGDGTVRCPGCGRPVRRVVRGERQQVSCACGYVYIGPIGKLHGDSHDVDLDLA